MRDTNKRSGGFAGLEEGLGAIDSDALPPPRRDQLTRLVRALRTLDASSATGESIGGDLVRYRVDIDDDQGKTTVTFVDDGEQGSDKRELVNELLAIG
ncbi:MAG TPA: protealysin inhibitor emfourin [Polyangiales bacterium]